MHLVVSISGHGFGHVAQTAPVLNALHELLPGLNITVRSPVAKRHLESRIRVPFVHLQSEGDIGMAMTSPLSVDAEKSRAAYRAFHSDWTMRAEDEAKLLETLRADFVLSNVGYLPLAGALLAKIPCAAFCSLNWSDIYRHCCILSEQDEIIAAQIQACYLGANAFLRATPGMEMRDLPNLIPVEPVAEIGENLRDELDRLLKLSEDERLVLVSMGGISGRLPIEAWPRGMRYLVQADWQARHPDAIAIESLPFSFGDLLASSDALICKPGYGSFVEAACSGIPVLYVDRPDWPESPALIAWLRQHGRCAEIAHGALLRGEIREDLLRLWDMPKPPAVSASGVTQVAGWLKERLRSSADGRLHRAHGRAPALPRSPCAPQ